MNGHNNNTIFGLVVSASILIQYCYCLNLFVNKFTEIEHSYHLFSFQSSLEFGPVHPCCLC